MSNSWHDIDRVLPLELAARSVAYEVADKNYTCDGFILPIINDQARTTYICTNYNMTSPKEIKFYINATWYGSNTDYT